MSFGRYSVNHPRTYDPVVMTTRKAAFRDVWKSSIALHFETNDVKAFDRSLNLLRMGRWPGGAKNPSVSKFSVGIANAEPINLHAVESLAVNWKR